MEHLPDQRHRCSLIGLVSAAFVDRHHLPAWLRIGIVMAAIGGYTTFSTFAAAVYAGTVVGDGI